MIVRRRLRAPPLDEAVLAEPPLERAADLLAANRRHLAESHLDLLGLPLSEVRRRAAAAVVGAAREYQRLAGEPVPAFADSAPLILAGHQPELFHPGVWVKSFALNGLARATGAVPINLVVDNDTAKATALRLPPPIGDDAATSPTLVPFDRWTGEVPYEERPVLDEELFASLPERAASIFQDWGFAPLLPAYWKEVLGLRTRTPLLGERLVGARRAIERSWGCHNLEVPLSRVCRTEPFAWFFGHFLAELPRFHEVHNTCLAEYRQLYRIRSRSHPVPDLAREGDWLEMPFWAWRVDRPQRGRLFARAGSAGVELRFDREAGQAFPFRLDGGPGAAVELWRSLEGHGLKVRSRALTTTIFARLFLGDLFIHGIGGAKYDELTDEILRRFFGLEPPGYLLLSATLLLPLPTYAMAPADCRKLARELRDLHWNPQRHLDGSVAADAGAREMLMQKRELMTREPPETRERREWFDALRDVTDRLRPFIEVREERARQAVLDCTHQRHVNEVRQRRDYAFCLFPEATLRPFLTRFLDPVV